MPLSKDVCRKCIKMNTVFEFNEYEWEQKGYVLCPCDATPEEIKAAGYDYELVLNKFIMHVDRDPPRGCLCLFEQAVAAGMKD